MKQVIEKFKTYKSEITNLPQHKLLIMEWFGSKKLAERAFSLINEIFESTIHIVRKQIHQMEEDLAEINRTIDSINSKVNTEYKFDPGFKPLDIDLLNKIKYTFEEPSAYLDHIMRRLEKGLEIGYSKDYQITLDSIFKDYLCPFQSKPIYRTTEDDIMDVLEALANEIWMEFSSKYPNLFDMFNFIYITHLNLMKLHSVILDYEEKEIGIFESRHERERSKYGLIIEQTIKNPNNNIRIQPLSTEDYFTYQEYQKNRLFGNYLIPNKKIKQELRSSFRLFEERAGSLIHNPLIEEYQKYKKDLKQFIRDKVHYSVTDDYARLKDFLGKYSRLLCTDEKQNGRYDRDTHPINTAGNRIAFHLFSQYRQIVVFDTETTGLNPSSDYLIEFGYQIYELNDDKIMKTKDGNLLIKLPQDQILTEKISQLTGISNSQLVREGKDIQIARELINEVFSQTSQTLFVAYNAQFDLSFLIEFTQSKNLFTKIDILDLYYPVSGLYSWFQYGYSEVKFQDHKLETICKVLDIKQSNTQFHRASFDAQMLMEIIKKLEYCGHGQELLDSINVLRLADEEFYKLPKMKSYQ